MRSRVFVQLYFQMFLLASSTLHEIPGVLAVRIDGDLNRGRDGPGPRVPPRDGRLDLDLAPQVQAVLLTNF